MRITAEAGSVALVVAILGLAALVLLPAALGYERYVIQTGSMSGTYDPGSIVFDKVTPVSELEKGDVITYGPPDAKQAGHLVTHRIVGVKQVGPRTAFKTKGDANDSPDPYMFYPDEPALPRVELSVPYIGYVYSELNTRRGRTIAFALPGILVALWVLGRLWRDAGRDARQYRLQASARHGDTG
jgi:signal peptidase